MKKVNQKTLISATKLVGGTIVRAAGTGAALSFVPETSRKIAQGAGIVAGVLLAAATSDKPMIASVGMGVAARSANDLIKESIKDKYTVTADSSDSDKAIAGAFGLACPDGGCGCGATSYVAPIASLNSPFFEEETTEDHYDLVYNEDTDVFEGDLADMNDNDVIGV